MATLTLGTGVQMGNVDLASLAGNPFASIYYATSMGAFS